MKELTFIAIIKSKPYIKKLTWEKLEKKTPQQKTKWKEKTKKTPNPTSRPTWGFLVWKKKRDEDGEIFEIFPPPPRKPKPPPHPPGFFFKHTPPGWGE
ncbi:MAG: hypothetical protein IPL23_13545 [Saprospiraceae bacterium]|nr:hypothetical protein [Saprospiraceae bacterium]